MKKYSLQERATLYNETFPQYSKFAWLQASDYWLWGIWSIGNNYRGSGYYGSFPPRFLDRVMSMFPDAENILHLFSGSLTNEVRGLRFDINSENNPDLVGDAHYLSEVDFNGKFDLIIADPPYSDEDALHYGTPMVHRNKVVKECFKVLEIGGYLLWLDQTLPMYRKDEALRCISIGVERSTNHRFRQLIGWKKIDGVVNEKHVDTEYSAGLSKTFKGMG